MKRRASPTDASQNLACAPQNSLVRWFEKASHRTTHATTTRGGGAPIGGIWPCEQAPGGIPPQFFASYTLRRCMPRFLVWSAGRGVCWVVMATTHLFWISVVAHPPGKRATRRRLSKPNVTRALACSSQRVLGTSTHPTTTCNAASFPLLPTAWARTLLVSFFPLPASPPA